VILEVFISGFVLGSISSFHCVGMCGPLALSLPLASHSRAQKALGIVLYNLGRVTTYSFIGLMFGFLGRQVFIAGFQQIFSIIAGVLILGFFVMAKFNKRFSGFGGVNYFYTKVQTLVAGFLRIRRMGGFYLTGLANGLLPCGMVYLAITGAMASSNPWHGMEFMAAFGLGTMPALMLLSFAGFIISIQARTFLRKLTPYAFLLMGALLVMRGLNLGIPFISPSFAATSAAVSCH
jgi:uncharacterized protein